MNVQKKSLQAGRSFCWRRCPCPYRCLVAAVDTERRREEMEEETTKEMEAAGRLRCNHAGLLGTSFSVHSFSE